MFSETEKAKLKQITVLYGRVKELIIFCEENQEELKANLHVVKELRDAFDHLMRVFAVKLEVRTTDGEAYIETSLEKVMGHVFRAGYDTLDFASIILRDKINKEISGYSSSSIQAAIPNYYSEIRPSIEGITVDIVKIRNNKDIAKPSPEMFDQYFNNIKRLEAIYRVILKAKPSMIEYSEKAGKDKRIDIGTELVVGIVVGAILVFVGLGGH